MIAMYQPLTIALAEINASNSKREQTNYQPQYKD